VHRDPDAHSQKDALLTQQVNWLFTAASDPDTGAEANEIDEAAFKACYQKLLSAAYEEEVLALDLTRAIDALQASEEWIASKSIFTGLRDLYAGLGTESLTQADPKHKLLRDALFGPITGRSTTLGPRTQTKARKIVAPLVDPAAPDVHVEKLIAVVKEILAAQVPPEVLVKGLEDAKAVANGTAPPAAASSSSTPAAAAAAAQ
jgi:hypothetical protein